jgi:RDD family
MIKNFPLPFPFGRRKPHVGPHYGDMYERSVALAIDILPLQHAMIFIYQWFDKLPPSLQPRPNNFAELFSVFWDVRYPWALHNLFVLFLIGVPYVACQIRFGTTPGRWLTGLKIVRNDSHEAPTVFQYIIRFLSYGFLLGMLKVLFNKKKRALHDYIAGTVVISTRPYGWYWQKIKQGFFWVRAKLFPARAVENTVAEPPAHQGHEDSDKPV